MPVYTIDASISTVDHMVCFKQHIDCHVIYYIIHSVYYFCDRQYKYICLCKRYIILQMFKNCLIQRECDRWQVSSTFVANNTISLALQNLKQCMGQNK